MAFSFCLCSIAPSAEVIPKKQKASEGNLDGTQKLKTNFVVDTDSDCYYISAKALLAKEKVPGLIILHCNGATAGDLDTFRFISDSLGWALATCHSSRNHRSVYLNDASIVHTINKLISEYPVDSSKVFLFGFSGQGSQAIASMFLHPDLIQGVVAICAHKGALPLARADALRGKFAYLVTRKNDWNRMDNNFMFQAFTSWGVRCTLVVTPGKHGAGSRNEAFFGCEWINRACVNR
ncbi:MAG: hypothetical protein ABIK18_04060 [candidate division WOR-3 bacterium]